jgi:hypothetical protein
MLVFGALAAAAGVEMLWRRATVPARALVIVLLTAKIAGFLLFRADYFGDYQARAWRRFDPNATREVAGVVIDLDRRSPLPMILLNDDGDNKGIRWWFYTTKHDRGDLWERTRYFQVDRLADTAAPPGSLFVIQAGDPRAAKLEAAGYTLVQTVVAVNGEPATSIFRRER